MPVKVDIWKPQVLPPPARTGTSSKAQTTWPDGRVATTAESDGVSAAAAPAADAHGSEGHEAPQVEKASGAGFLGAEATGEAVEQSKASGGETAARLAGGALVRRAAFGNAPKAGPPFGTASGRATDGGNGSDDGGGGTSARDNTGGYGRGAGGS